MTGVLSKKQICQYLNVSDTTLRYYLNRRYFSELSLLGYQKNQKLLTPCQINYLREKIGLQTDEKE